jgi:hypothetical protein
MRGRRNDAKSRERNSLSAGLAGSVGPLRDPRERGEDPGELLALVLLEPFEARLERSALPAILLGLDGLLDHSAGTAMLGHVLEKCPLRRLQPLAKAIDLTLPESSHSRLLSSSRSEISAISVP